MNVSGSTIYGRAYVGILSGPIDLLLVMPVVSFPAL